MSDEQKPPPRFPDYAEWAGLKRNLGAARYRREHLDYPLFVRVSEEPRKDRRATDAEVAEWKANADAEIEKISTRLSEIEALRAAEEDEHEAVRQELNEVLMQQGLQRLRDLDEELQRADDAMERAGFTRGSRTPEQAIDELEARNKASLESIIDLQLEPASLAAEVLQNLEMIERLTAERDEARAGYHALDKNWEAHHEACMRPIRAIIGNADASVGEIVQAIEQARKAAAK